MKKQKRQFVIILCVLALFAGGYLVIKNIPKEEDAADGIKSYTVTSVEQEDVTGLSYLYEGTPITLVKEDSIWKSKEDKSLSLDQTVISNMLSNVCDIVTDTVIENPENLEEYGLAGPENTICLTLSDGSTIQLLVGDYLDITGEYYIQPEGDANVYTVPSYIPSAFYKPVDLLVVTEEAMEEITE